MMIGRLTLLGSLALAGCGMEGGDTPAYPIQGCRSPRATTEAPIGWWTW